MGSGHNLRHRLCIFSFLGILGHPLAAKAQIYAPFKTIPNGSMVSNGFGIQRTTINVVAFRLTSDLTVTLDENLTRPIQLKAGDVIDAGFDLPSEADVTSLRSTLGEDNYIKYELASRHKGTNLRMKIKDASKNSIENKIIYVRPALLRFMTLVYDPGFGKVGTTGVEMADSDGDGKADLNGLAANDIDLWGGLPAPGPDDEIDTQEIPDFQVKTQGPSGPGRTAAPRVNLPTMKLGMPNLFGTINSAFSNYSQSTSVNRLVQSAYSHVFTAGPHGRKVETYIVYHRVRVGKHWRYQRQTLCWRAVKDALHSSGLVSSGFASASPNAYEARADLMREGFRDLLADARTADVMRNPDMAPKGAIIVYEDVVGKRAMTGNRYPGHVEIKTTLAGQGGYISINPQTKAAYGMFADGKRKLIGVMVRDT